MSHQDEFASDLNDLLATIEVCRRSLPLDADRHIHLKRLASIEYLILEAVAHDHSTPHSQTKEFPSSSEIDRLTGP